MALVCREEETDEDIAAKEAHAKQLAKEATDKTEKEAKLKADAEAARARAQKNIKAFLDMIAFSELGPALLAKSDNGYNVLYGGGLFQSYEDHPRKYLTFKIKGKPVTSSAAGRYQILAGNYDFYRKKLGLQDFSHASQDAIAIRLITEQRALSDVAAGKFDDAVDKVRNIWASMPKAGYGQHEQKIETLRAAYVKAGGSLAA